jgi:CheY-like chemotaxis protein
MQKLLGKEGYSVVTAEDGVEGLERYAEWRAPFIVVDLMMAEMDDFQ